MESDDTVPMAPGGLLPDSIVWTPEIERLNQFIVESLRMQSRGCAVMGQQCNGKSQAARYLTNLLPETLGHTVAVSHWEIAMKQLARKTDRGWVQDRMLQSDCNAVNHRDEAVLWRRLHAHLTDMAINAGSRWLIIIVDEAQNLRFADYFHLIYTFNALEKANIKPFFMLVGQPDLATAPSRWKETNGMQVIGRFFSRTYWYNGIASEDLADVLEAFDEPSRRTSGARISADLMPQVLGTDWHLGAWAPQFADAMAILVTEHRITGGALRLPMQWLRSTLLLLLMRVMDLKLHPVQVNAAMVVDALRQSDFISQVAYYIHKSTPPAHGVVPPEAG